MKSKKDKNYFPKEGGYTRLYLYLNGVQECSFLDKDNALKVHFDNSITDGIPLGSASYTDRKLKHEWGQKHWSNRANSFRNKYWQINM